jgi:hypothetical protein
MGIKPTQNDLRRPINRARIGYYARGSALYNASLTLIASAHELNGPATTLLASKTTYWLSWTVFAIKYCALMGLNDAFSGPRVSTCR